MPSIESEQETIPGGFEFEDEIIVPDTVADVEALPFEIDASADVSAPDQSDGGGYIGGITGAVGGFLSNTFGFGSSKPEASIDVDANVEGNVKKPSVNLGAPSIGGGFGFGGGIKKPDIDANVDAPSIGGGIGFGGGIKKPDIDANVDTPSIGGGLGFGGGIKKPDIDANIDAPSIGGGLGFGGGIKKPDICLLYTSPSPRDKRQSRMPSSA